MQYIFQRWHIDQQGKMNYMFISFFPSELQKGKDIYTEFVSIDYESEDPKTDHVYYWQHQ